MNHEKKTFEQKSDEELKRILTETPIHHQNYKLARIILDERADKKTSSFNKLTIILLGFSIIIAIVTLIITIINN